MPGVGEPAIFELSGYASELCVLETPVPLDPMPHIMAWHRRNDGYPAQRWLRDCVAKLSL